MAQPDLPEGSGDAESPEEPQEEQLRLWDERARMQQERAMVAFERALDGYRKAKRPNRGSFNDYGTKNCEEAWGGRP